MSVFHGTFDKFVAGQLNARKEIINAKQRKDIFLKFTTGKNSWVRMVSQVNVGNDKDRLSKQWTLYGGVPVAGTTSDLRYGVGYKGSSEGIYNNNLNSIELKNGKWSQTSDSAPYGPRPMPGITSVESINKGAFGSLRQTTVKFICWDTYQLNQLEKLYMRPGYSVFIEWGWSQYLDHPIPANINDSPIVNEIKNFDTFPIDPFKLTDIKDTYNKIDNAVEKHKGNYRGVLGYITNYSWQMLPNGGFECSTVIISHGNILESIKASSNPYTLVGSTLTANDPVINTTLDPSGIVVERPVLSNFEKYFLNIKGYFNQTELFDAGGEFYTQYDGSAPPTQLADTQKIQSNIVVTVDDIRNEIIKYNTSHPFLILSGFDLDTYSSYIPLDSNASFTKPTDGTSDGSGFEYIPIDDLFAILETFFIPKDENGNAIIRLVQPFKGRYLACEDTVSIDPTICLLGNSNATFLVPTSSAIYGNVGFAPYLYKPTMTSITSLISASFDSGSVELPFEAVTNIGTRGNGDSILNLELGLVYININCILDTYRGLINSDGVSIIDFLNALFEKISFALGGINDFKVLNTGNIIRIIDTKYLETSSDPDGAYNKKFKFDLIGLKSICRDVKINSRIFSEQSSMMAIAAANANNPDVNNLGDLYTSTQQHLNSGLTDRIITKAYITDPSSASPPAGLPQSVAQYYQIYWSTIQPLENYLIRKVIGTPQPPNNIHYIKTPSQEEVQNAYSLLNTHLLQINSKDLDYKAIIPFELEITLDGIDGFSIGDVYTIDPSALPSVYTGDKSGLRKVGFILTGVQHNLQNNDWTTTLQGQMCLLDNDKIKNTINSNIKQQFKNAIAAVRNQLQTNSYLAYAMVDYLLYLTINVLRNGPTYTSQGLDKAGGIGLPKTNLLSTFTYQVNCGSFGYDYQTQLHSDPNEVLATINNTQNSAGTSTAEKRLDLARSTIQTAMDKGTGGLPFYDASLTDPESTNTYLYKWWSINKAAGYPNFPATFKELIGADVGGGTIIDLTKHLYTVGGGASSNFDRWIYEENIFRGTGAINGNNLFIYKIFSQGSEFKPLEFLKSTYTTAPSKVDGGLQADKGIALDLEKLRFKYISLISTHINSDWGSDRSLIDMRAAGVNVTIESDQTTRDRPGKVLGGSIDPTPPFKIQQIPWYREC